MPSQSLNSEKATISQTLNSKAWPAQTSNCNNAMSLQPFISDVEKHLQHSEPNNINISGPVNSDNTISSQSLNRHKVKTSEPLKLMHAAPSKNISCLKVDKSTSNTKSSRSQNEHKVKTSESLNLKHVAPSDNTLPLKVVKSTSSQHVFSKKLTDQVVTSLKAKCGRIRTKPLKSAKKSTTSYQQLTFMEMSSRPTAAANDVGKVTLTQPLTLTLTDKHAPPSESLHSDQVMPIINAIATSDLPRIVLKIKSGKVVPPPVEITFSDGSTIHVSSSMAEKAKVPLAEENSMVSITFANTCDNKINTSDNKINTSDCKIINNRNLTMTDQPVKEHTNERNKQSLVRGHSEKVLTSNRAEKTPIVDHTEKPISDETEKELTSDQTKKELASDRTMKELICYQPEKALMSDHSKKELIGHHAETKQVSERTEKDIMNDRTEKDLMSYQTESGLTSSCIRKATISYHTKKPTNDCTNNELTSDCTEKQQYKNASRSGNKLKKVKCVIAKHSSQAVAKSAITSMHVIDDHLKMMPAQKYPSVALQRSISLPISSDFVDSNVMPSKLSTLRQPTSLSKLKSNSYDVYDFDAEPDFEFHTEPGITPIRGGNMMHEVSTVSRRLDGGDTPACIGLHKHSNATIRDPSDACETNLPSQTNAVNRTVLEKFKTDLDSPKSDFIFDLRNQPLAKDMMESSPKDEDFTTTTVVPGWYAPLTKEKREFSHRSHKPINAGQSRSVVGASPRSKRCRLDVSTASTEIRRKIPKIELGPTELFDSDKDSRVMPTLQRHGQVDLCDDETIAIEGEQNECSQSQQGKLGHSQWSNSLSELYDLGCGQIHYSQFEHRELGQGNCQMINCKVGLCPSCSNHSEHGRLEHREKTFLYNQSEHNKLGFSQSCNSQSEHRNDQSDSLKLGHKNMGDNQSEYSKACKRKLDRSQCHESKPKQTLPGNMLLDHTKCYKSKLCDNQWDSEKLSQSQSAESTLAQKQPHYGQSNAQCFNTSNEGPFSAINSTKNEQIIDDSLFLASSSSSSYRTCNNIGKSLKRNSSSSSGNTTVTFSVCRSSELSHQNICSNVEETNNKELYPFFTSCLNSSKTSQHCAHRETDESRRSQDDAKSLSTKVLTDILPGRLISHQAEDFKPLCKKKRLKSDSHVRVVHEEMTDKAVHLEERISIYSRLERTIDFGKDFSVECESQGSRKRKLSRLKVYRCNETSLLKKTKLATPKNSRQKTFGESSLLFSGVAVLPSLSGISNLPGVDDDDRLSASDLKIAEDKPTVGQFIHRRDAGNHSSKGMSPTQSINLTEEPPPALVDLRPPLRLKVKRIWSDKECADLYAVVNSNPSTLKPCGEFSRNI